MRSFTQGELFIVRLVSIEKCDRDYGVNKVVLSIMNLAVDQTVFQSVLSEVFAEHELRESVGATLISGEMNLEKLLDGEDDFLDTGKFLEELANSVLQKLKVTPRWGEDGSADKTAEYNDLD